MHGHVVGERSGALQKALEVRPCVAANVDNERCHAEPANVRRVKRVSESAARRVRSECSARSLQPRCGLVHAPYLVVAIARKVCERCRPVCVGEARAARTRPRPTGARHGSCLRPTRRRGDRRGAACGARDSLLVRTRMHRPTPIPIEVRCWEFRSGASTTDPTHQHACLRAPPLLF